LAKLTLPEQELMRPGHAACPGCGGGLAMRYLLKGLGPNTAIAVPACCWAVIGQPFPATVLDIPWLDCAFETTGATISGMRAAADALGVKDVNILGFAGDGGTADIGLQALSGMLERGTDAIYVMYDNEAYMNTGVQKSGATPEGAWTTTTPTSKTERGKHGAKKDVFAIVLAHGPAFAATANVAFPEDLVRKAKKMAGIKGPRFLHVLSPCPPGWRFSPEMTVEVGRLATDTNVFPLMEYEDGRLKINRKPSAPKPVRTYLEAQGRFKHLNPDEVAAIQAHVDRRWQELLAREAAARAAPVAPA
jgi:2-oxoisovalerate ferredoxin oxidoreductase beta subunit